MDDKKVFKSPCSVTAFDMEFSVLSDGRERGLWTRLEDYERNPNIAEMALLEWDEVRRLRDRLTELLKEHQSAINGDSVG